MTKTRIDALLDVEGRWFALDETGSLACIVGI
jgi:hypothetical protein